MSITRDVIRLALAGVAGQPNYEMNQMTIPIKGPLRVIDALKRIDTNSLAGHHLDKMVFEEIRETHGFGDIIAFAFFDSNSFGLFGEWMSHLCTTNLADFVIKTWIKARWSHNLVTFDFSRFHNWSNFIKVFPGDSFSRFDMSKVISILSNDPMCKPKVGFRTLAKGSGLFKLDLALACVDQPELWMEVSLKYIRNVFTSITDRARALHCIIKKRHEWNPLFFLRSVEGERVVRRFVRKPDVLSYIAAYLSSEDHDMEAHNLLQSAFRLLAEVEDMVYSPNSEGVLINDSDIRTIELIIGYSLTSHSLSRFFKVAISQLLGFLKDADDTSHFDLINNLVKFETQKLNEAKTHIQQAFESMKKESDIIPAMAQLLGKLNCHNKFQIARLKGHYFTPLGVAWGLKN